MVSADHGKQRMDKDRLAQISIKDPRVKPDMAEAGAERRHQEYLLRSVAVDSLYEHLYKMLESDSTGESTNGLSTTPDNRERGFQ